MKRIIIIVILFLAQFTVAQNLVPNRSFEDTLTCPTMLAQIVYSNGWSSFRESPDYFNSCAPSGGFSNPSVPLNSWGYQYPLTGNAYAGFSSYSKNNANWREYLGIQLNQNLVIGQNYYISFHVSRASSISNHMNIASNKLGLKFFTNAYSMMNPAPVNNIVHLFSDSIIGDTTNWIEITGFFIADSAYQYLCLGNFFNDSVTGIISYDSNATYAYYYVDDVIVMDSTVTGENEFENHGAISIYENSFTDEVVIRGSYLKYVQIYDITGRKVVEQNCTISPHRIDTRCLTKGMYLVMVTTRDGTYSQKVVKRK